MSLKHRANGIVILFAAVFIFLMTGCIKMSIPIPPPPKASPPATPPSGGSFSANFADTAWTARYYTAYFYQGRNMFKFIGVADGMKGDSTYAVIMFYTPFQLDQPISTSVSAEVYYADWLDTFDWDAGNNSGYAVSYVNVTAYDSASHSIAGSFHGYLSNAMPSGDFTKEIAVSNGTFNLTYTLQP
jgi:hypothetical protein